MQQLSRPYAPLHWILYLALAGFAAVAVAVHVDATRSFDEEVLRSFREADPPHAPVGPHWLRSAAHDVTALGSYTVLTLFVVFTTLILVHLRWWSEVVMLLLASIGGLLVSNLLKALFARTRPDVVPHLVDVASLSFPSGHAMMSTSIYLTLAMIVAGSSDYSRFRMYALVTAVLVSFFVGLSRVYLGVHYPTDVAAGWCLGMAWAVVSRWLSARIVTGGPRPGEMS